MRAFSHCVCYEYVCDWQKNKFADSSIHVGCSAGEKFQVSSCRLWRFLTASSSSIVSLLNDFRFHKAINYSTGIYFDVTILKGWLQNPTADSSVQLSLFRRIQSAVGLNSALILICHFDDDICATLLVEHLVWPCSKLCLVNKLITLPLCPTAADCR